MEDVGEVLAVALDEIRGAAQGLQVGVGEGDLAVGNGGEAHSSPQPLGLLPSEPVSAASWSAR